MQYKIIVDSCCDYNEEAIKSENVIIKNVSMYIYLDNKIEQDHTNSTKAEFLDIMKVAHSIRTACPSVHDYLTAYEGEQDIFVITTSEKLSGSYQSAQIAKEAYFETYGKNKKIHIFNSLSACAGQSLLLYKLIELCEQEISFEDIITTMNNTIKEHNIFFVLQSLGNLAKAGRVNSLVAKGAAMLNVRCIMTRTEIGQIDLFEKTIGEKRSLIKLAEIVANIKANCKATTLCISHCQAMPKVDFFLDKLKDLCEFSRIIIQETNKTTSFYADFGGLVVAF